MHIGAAIVDADDQRAAVLEVGDADIGRDRQRRMRAGNGVGGEDFAVGGAAAVEIGAVPGCFSLGDIIGLLARRIGLAADLIGIADEIAAATLGRIGIVGDARRDGDAEFR